MDECLDDNSWDTRGVQDLGSFWGHFLHASMLDTAKLKCHDESNV